MISRTPKTIFSLISSNSAEGYLAIDDDLVKRDIQLECAQICTNSSTKASILSI